MQEFYAHTMKGDPWRIVIFISCGAQTSPEQSDNDECFYTIRAYYAFVLKILLAPLLQDMFSSSKPVDLFQPEKETFPSRPKPIHRHQKKNTLPDCTVKSISYAVRIKREITNWIPEILSSFNYIYCELFASSKSFRV